MMDKEIANKVLKKKEKKGIPQFEKVWYSITKFEKYPEMAAEGTPKAFIYLLFLSLVTSIIIGIAITIQLGKIIRSSIDFFNDNITSVVYENGELHAEIKGDNIIETEFGTLIVDTNDLDSKKKAEYEGKILSNQVGIIWFKDEVELKIDGNATHYNYKEILDRANIKSFDKETILRYLNENVNKYNTYIFYFGSQGVVALIVFFISTLADILILSIFGVLTAIITKVSLRYRAIFNMSTYAITLSAILQTIYRIARLYTNFEIKHFDLMYTAISYICLTAAIFMIRSDVIKQQIELIKLREEKEMKENIEEKTKEEEEKNEEKEEKTEKKDEQKEKQEGIDGESEGSNA